MEAAGTNQFQAPLVHIDRQVLAQNYLEETLQDPNASASPKGIWQQLKSSATKNYTDVPTLLKNFITGMFPFLVWLPQYSWKIDFPADIIAGCTIAVMHIPQGMGYAILAGVDPIVGIYMAVFPVAMYFFVGTSRHISLGTLAITTLMTGRIVNEWGSTPQNMTLAALSNSSDIDNPTNLEVATIVCFMVGIWQIGMGLFHLGVVGVILSEHLVGGFTTGSAIHVLMSQIKNLLGIKIPRYSGAFQLIKTAYSIILAVPSSNITEVIISSITIFCLAVHNDWLKPWYGKKTKFPVPIELILLAVGIASSYFGELHEKYDVDILGTIPTGIPTPKLPLFGFIPNILLDTVILAIVVYALSLSMAKIFARKSQYQIDSNQELYALGASNVLGSFFSCVPVSASLSRSVLQYATGGKTQIASLVSCALLTIVLLWVGPIFETLPLAVLSSVIVVTLKGMLMQFKELKTLVKISPLDAVVWVISFLATVLIDIDIGLAFGAIASISVLVYRGHRPHVAILGRLPESELYVDTSVYPTAVEEPGMKIFRWVGAIQFANGEVFQNALDSHLPSTPKKETFSTINRQINQAENDKDGSPIKFGAWEESGDTPSNEHSPAAAQNNIGTEHFICDFSAVSYIDLVGSNMLKTMNTDLKVKHIQLILVVCSDHLIHQLQRYDFFADFSKTRIYPSVLDAVLSIKSGSGIDDLLDSHQVP